MFDTDQYLETLAAKWGEKFPAHKKRITKALRLANTGKVAPRGLNSFRVVGSKPGVEHLVEVNCGFPRCSCPYNGRCSHIWAAALVTRLASEIERLLAVRPRATTKPRRSQINCPVPDSCRPLAVVIPIRR